MLAAWMVLGILVLSGAAATLVSGLWAILVFVVGTTAALVLAWAAGPSTEAGQQPMLEEEEPRRAA